MRPTATPTDRPTDRQTATPAARPAADRHTGPTDTGPTADTGRPPTAYTGPTGRQTADRRPAADRPPTDRADRRPADRADRAADHTNSPSGPILVSGGGSQPWWDIPLYTDQWGRKVYPLIDPTVFDRPHRNRR